MLYDLLSNLGRYKGVNPGLDQAIEFLCGCRLAEFQNGRTEIDGEQLYANCFEYDTAPARELTFESHIQYLDLHIVLSGTEYIEVTNEADLTITHRDEAGDCILLQGDGMVAIKMDISHFLVVWPGEAHKPKVACGESRHVRKAVVKIKL